MFILTGRGSRRVGYGLLAVSRIEQNHPNNEQDGAERYEHAEGSIPQVIVRIKIDRRISVPAIPFHCGFLCSVIGEGRTPAVDFRNTSESAVISVCMKTSYTKDQLIQAVKTSRNFAQVRSKLGLKSDSTVSIRKYIDLFVIDTSHFSKYKWTIEVFKETVKHSASIAQALDKMGLCMTGNAYKHFKKCTIELGIDTSHFTGQAHLRGKRHNWSKSKIPLEKCLVEDSGYGTSRLRQRLIAANMLEAKCSWCGITEWRGKAAPLELDHINGINNDHRIENLRILCPNCHAQTPTHAGRNNRIYVARLREVKEPKQPKIPKPKLTDEQKTANAIEKAFKQRKVERPSKNELTKLVWEKPTVLLGLDFGVSDKAIEKWCKAYGIQKPPRGYWAKEKAGKM